MANFGLACCLWVCVQHRSSAWKVVRYLRKGFLVDFVLLAVAVLVVVICDACGHMRQIPWLKCSDSARLSSLQVVS
eukprot:183448-Amphidinium_carterae.1